VNNETQAQAQPENDEIDESIDDTQSNLSEETVDVESTEQDGTPTETEPKKSRNQNAKARLRRKLSESEQRNQQMADLLTKQNEKFTTLETKLDSVINPPAARPDRVDFETEENYEDALYDWRQPAKAEEKPTPAYQEQSTQKSFAPDEVREHWLDQVDLAEDKYSDFDKKLKAIPLENMTDIMTLSIMESDHAGDIAYFLGDNLPEAKRISKLKLAAQVKEIDKLGNKFQSNTSSAPAPIVPTAGADSPIADLSKMSMKDYAAYMNKKEYGG
jgi:hypothetical protein